ncbi:cell division control protein 48 [Colletotrichum higginsianum]|uniref:Cell division control protein 48 n=1 Tax=Colletotrichum higginsianum (strain IMI 349063) TaxID=759273 RepID=H1VY79_COLHI|nr:cell division control protein 48 [Colletotrichum higginsianum]
MRESRRPGRHRAGSSCSGLLVAPMTKTFFFEVIPSISVEGWLTTRSEAPPASPMDPPRALAMESNSSRKTIQGAAARALSKMSRMLLSDSPNHMLRSSGPLTEMKLAAHSLATALANIVLPVPGGP